MHAGRNRRWDDPIVAVGPKVYERRTDFPARDHGRSRPARRLRSRHATPNLRYELVKMVKVRRPGPARCLDLSILVRLKSDSDTRFPQDDLVSRLETNTPGSSWDRHGSALSHDSCSVPAPVIV